MAQILLSFLCTHIVHLYTLFMKTNYLLPFMLIALFSSNVNAQVITTIAGTGVHGYSGDGGPAIAANLLVTTRIAADVAGNVFIYDAGGTDRIRKVNTSGIINTIAGRGRLAIPAMADLLLPLR
jgi:hypothetical protein